jgi:hypothetical protein
MMSPHNTDLSESCLEGKTFQFVSFCCRCILWARRRLLQETTCLVREVTDRSDVLRSSRTFVFPPVEPITFHSRKECQCRRRNVPAESVSQGRPATWPSIDEPFQIAEQKRPVTSVSVCPR